MKKLIINLGQEAIVGAIYEVTGKARILKRVLEIPSFDYYNNHGRLDIHRIVIGIKKLLPKEARNLDIDLILPTYVTDVKYINTIDDQVEQNEKKDQGGPRNEKTVFIGESQTRKINQLITYSNKEVSNIITTFHKEKLNVVRALSAASCYHNYLSVFNMAESYGGVDFKAHVGIVWGVSKVTYLIMLGNLPVEARISDFSLRRLYDDVVSMGCELPMYQILKVLNNFVLSTDPETGILLECKTALISEGSRVFEVSENVINIIKDAFFDYLTSMVQEVRTIYDYTRDRYSVSNVFVCSNSKLLDECLCKTFTDAFPIEYIGEVNKLEVYENKLQLKSMEDVNDKYVPIIGCVIEGIKKGSDFYDN